ncbi:hypothetical protein NM208_g3841 [Fusarium decemcellulare]|uniref:Uncharacterized protein n=1 Tax=Fusarium decemcellulare TaxID=57161 RepID=A0ACC1SN30_9HYPO|nr:hypothetical protein NM208_g3841 [Fusarium decemcellulare]
MPNWAPPPFLFFSFLFRSSFDSAQVAYPIAPIVSNAVLESLAAMDLAIPTHPTPDWVEAEWGKIQYLLNKSISGISVPLDTFIAEIKSNACLEKPTFPTSVFVAIPIARCCFCLDNRCTWSPQCGEVIMEKTFFITIAPISGLRYYVKQANGAEREFSWDRDPFIPYDGLTWPERLQEQGQRLITQTLNAYNRDLAVYIGRKIWLDAMEATDPHQALVVPVFPSGLEFYDVRFTAETSAVDDLNGVLSYSSAFHDKWTGSITSPHKLFPLPPTRPADPIYGISPLNQPPTEHRSSHETGFGRGPNNTLEPQSASSLLESTRANRNRPVPSQRPHAEEDYEKELDNSRTRISGDSREILFGKLFDPILGAAVEQARKVLCRENAITNGPNIQAA